MTDLRPTHARRRSRVGPDPLIGRTDYDYADAFEIQLPTGDDRSPEQLFRATVDNASSVMRWVPMVHRHVLQFRLGPRSSPDHIFGWRIVTSDPDVVHLEAAGPLMRGVIVGRRTASTAVLTTFVFYVSRARARVVWAIIGPLHRRIAPNLLERAANRHLTQP
jgi:hypothetical protein